MKKILLLSVIVSWALASCNKEAVPLTRAQINHTIDSLIKAGNEQSDEQARIDLERRMKIEVKVKVDSILSAKSHQAARNTPPNAQ